MHYVDRIQDRFGNYIFSQDEYISNNEIKNIIAFPWLDTIEMNANKPYYLLEPVKDTKQVIDPRISFLMSDVLKGFMKNGVAGRKARFLDRDLILWNSPSPDNPQTEEQAWRVSELLLVSL